MQTVKLGDVEVGSGHPPYIIAEAGSNHNGDMSLCRLLIDSAGEAGANAVKFQSWTDKSLIAEEEYDRNTEYSDKKKHFGSLREMVTAYQLTADQHAQAHARCVERGIAFCSTPFSCGKWICSIRLVCRSSRLRQWMSRTFRCFVMSRAKKGLW